MGPKSWYANREALARNRTQNRPDLTDIDRVMSGDANDCYLCGAKNDAGASFCGRCNGQLLQLGEAPADPEPEVVDDEPIELQPKTSKRMDSKSRLGQLRRKSTLDDSRLSDALGLAGVDDADLDAATEPAPTTAIPKATPSTEIPMLGTHAAVSTTQSLRPEAPSRRVWVCLLYTSPSPRDS